MSADTAGAVVQFIKQGNKPRLQAAAFAGETSNLDTVHAHDVLLRVKSALALTDVDGPPQAVISFPRIRFEKSLKMTADSSTWPDAAAVIEQFCICQRHNSGLRCRQNW